MTWHEMTRSKEVTYSCLLFCWVPRHLMRLMIGHGRCRWLVKGPRNLLRLLSSLTIASLRQSHVSGFHLSLSYPGSLRSWLRLVLVKALVVILALLHVVLQLLLLELHDLLLPCQRGVPSIAFHIIQLSVCRCNLFYPIASLEFKLLTSCSVRINPIIIPNQPIMK